MRIGIDVDDTITNSSKVIRRYIKSHLKSDDIKNNLEGIMRGTYVTGELIDFYKINSKKIGNEIQIKKDSAEIIKKLHDNGNEIYIITARSDNYYDNAYEFTSKYLEKNNIYYDKLFTSQIYKTKLCQDEKIDLMIDDSIDIVDELYDIGKKSILFTSSINKNKKCKSKRLSSWKDIYNYIDKL